MSFIPGFGKHAFIAAKCYGVAEYTTGARTGNIVVTSDFNKFSGTFDNLVDGGFAANSTDSFNMSTATGTYITFDFGIGARVVVTEAKWYQNNTTSHTGSWKWQGSNDNSSFTDIGTTFTWGGVATQTITTLSGNTVGYRYYRLFGGTPSSNPWFTEMEFKVQSANGLDGATLALFHFDGTDASTHIPEYTFKNAVTIGGNAQIDTAQSVFGGSSLLLDGSGDYVRLASRSAFGIGTGEFCIDSRVRFNSTASQGYICSQGSSSNLLSVDYNSGNLRCVVGGTAYTFAWSPSTATWYHVAVSRSGSSLRAFIDGTQIGTTQTCTDSVTADIMTIGARFDGAASLNGWLDEFRYSNVARFTSNFTPPAAPYGIL